jgi:hypothetical protein
MAFGPRGRVYVMTENAGVLSFLYNRDTGALREGKVAVPGVAGIGIAFRENEMYVSTFDGAIRRLRDQNGNGLWGEPGETNVAIVTGLPVGDGAVNQIQVRNNTLFVGIGRRTANGYRGELTGASISDKPGDSGFWFGGTGWTWGDGVYNGTIATIRDLRTVPDETGWANGYADSTLTEQLIRNDFGPFEGGQRGRTDKLLVHSAGTRNPFGLALDREGSLFFTNNFHRVRTNGDGTVGFGYPRDVLGPDFSKDVQDQAFRAVEGADYGFADVNWRGKSPFLNPNLPNYRRVTSLTFDNLFNQGPYALHNPAEPDGLGPSASADGCSFFYANGLPEGLQGNLFVARFNGTVTESEAPGDNDRRSLTYQDVVGVDVKTGKVRRVAQGFAAPLALLWDGSQRLLVGDYGTGNLFAIRPAVRRLVSEAKAERDGEAVIVYLRVTNRGDVPITNFRLTSAVLGDRPTTTSPLPSIPGTLAPGQGETLRLRFVGSSLEPGAYRLFRATGVYNDGGAYEFSSRLRIP